MAMDLAFVHLELARSEADLKMAKRTTRENHPADRPFGWAN